MAAGFQDDCASALAIDEAVAVADVGHVNAHGLSTVDMDRAEAATTADTTAAATAYHTRSRRGMPLGGGGIAKRRAGALMSLSRGRGFFDLLHDGDLPGFLDDDLGATCLLYTSPSPRDGLLSRMPSSA